MRVYVGSIWGYMLSSIQQGGSGPLPVVVWSSSSTLPSNITKGSRVNKCATWWARFSSTPAPRSLHKARTGIRARTRIRARTGIRTGIRARRRTRARIWRERRGGERRRRGRGEKGGGQEQRERGKWGGEEGERRREKREKRRSTYLALMASSTGQGISLYSANVRWHAVSPVRCKEG